MNIESYFIKEFKSYSDFKAKLLNGMQIMNNPRINMLMNNLPTNRAMQIGNGMLSQMRYLTAQDICSGANGEKPTPAAILSASIPPTMQLIDNMVYVEYCAIMGIKEPYFSDLNKTTGKLQQRLSYKKRITGSDLNFLTDKDGNVMTRDVDIPQGSRVILSHKSIHLPNLVKTESGATRRVSVLQGFGYLDYVDTSAGRKFLYYLPKEYIYPCNLCCLLLTSSRLTSRYYWGRKYIFNRGISAAYLYVVPYEKRILKRDNVLFCLKDSVDFDKEISALESAWQSCVNAVGVPSPSLLYPFDELQLYSSMDKSDSGDCNLGFQTLPVRELEPYSKIGLSLAEMQKDQGDETANKGIQL